ncbi:hypothetical protein IWX47DRAFT_686781 [Phyllosticta citricarpa]
MAHSLLGERLTGIPSWGGPDWSGLVWSGLVWRVTPCVDGCIARSKLPRFRRPRRPRRRVSFRSACMVGRASERLNEAQKAYSSSFFPPSPCRASDNKPFFSGWCVVSFIWVWASMTICVIYPVVESRNAVVFVCKGLLRDALGAVGMRSKERGGDGARV